MCIVHNNVIVNSAHFQFQAEMSITGNFLCHLFIIVFAHAFECIWCRYTFNLMRSPYKWKLYDFHSWKRSSIGSMELLMSTNEMKLAFLGLIAGNCHGNVCIAHVCAISYVLRNIYLIILREKSVFSPSPTIWTLSPHFYITCMKLSSKITQLSMNKYSARQLKAH